MTSNRFDAILNKQLTVLQAQIEAKGERKREPLRLLLLGSHC